MIVQSQRKGVLSFRLGYHSKRMMAHDKYLQTLYHDLHAYRMIAFTDTCSKVRLIAPRWWGSLHDERKSIWLCFKINDFLLTVKAPHKERKYGKLDSEYIELQFRRSPNISMAPTSTLTGQGSINRARQSSTANAHAKVTELSRR
jgi:hypothetical protein